MPDLINLTQARSNLSRLMDSVWVKKKKFILIRDSIPQAVIIPYSEYQQQEKRWQEEIDNLMVKSEEAFNKWLNKRRMKRPSTEKRIYELIDKVSGRN